MNIAKATEQDIQLAYDIHAILDTVTDGYYPSLSEADTDAPEQFDPDNLDHLRHLHDTLVEKMRSSPSGLARVIWGFGALADPENGIIDQDSNVLALHPNLAQTKTPVFLKVIEWLANGNTGTSSKTMAFWLTFEIKPLWHDTPHDPPDLNRCLLLLQLTPELRPLIPKMAEISERWARLVAHWDRIEQTFLDEAGIGWTKSKKAPKTYYLMKSAMNGELAPNEPHP